MVGRMKKGAKQAAQADLARGLAPEEVMARHGIKSRRTLRAWKAEARAAEAKSGASTEGAAGAPPPADGNGGAEPIDAGAPDARAPGDAEAVLFMVRFGVSFTTKTAGMVVGFAPSSPVVQLYSKLTSDEEDMIRKCAPSLLPAFTKMAEWMEKHSVAVAAVLFGSMMLPRAITLAMAAKEVRKREREAGRPHRTTPRDDAEPGDPPPRSDKRDGTNGLPTIPLHPKGGES